MQFLLQIQNLVIFSISIITFISLLFLKSIRLNGIIIYSVSFVLFIISSRFNNLFIQFITVSILLVFFLTMIFYWFLYFFYRKNKIIINSINNGHINPFKRTLLKAEIKNFRFLFPGIYFMVKFNLKEKERIVEEIFTSFEHETKNLISFKTSFKRHGEFIIKDFEFVIKDVLGLTQKNLKCDFEHPISIYPNFLESVEMPFFLDKGGEEVIQSVVRIDSTDFYENRKYYPGDDTRRINWNIFAHSGELHIREVEKVPPKVGQILMVFAPYSKHIEEYEHISSVFLATVHYLLKYGFQLKIIYPGSNEPVLLDANSEKIFTSVMNDSYFPIENKALKNIKNSVIFTSFDEYKRLQSENKIIQSFIAVSFLEKAKPGVFKDIRSYIMIKEHDNLFKEIETFYKNKQDQDKREERLIKQQALSMKNNINVRLFRVGKYFEKTK